MKWLVLAVLRVVLPNDWGPDIVRDMDEAHRRRREERGRVRAGAWLAGQGLLFFGRFAWERLRELAPACTGGDGASSLARDVGLGFRTFRRAPLFSGTVVLTLGVAIGANTAVFSVVRPVVLESLPYPDPDRLLVIDPNPWTPAEIVVELERSGTTFDGIAGFYPRRFTVTGGERPEELEGAVVTPGFFWLLGARMALGRGPGEGDVVEGGRTAVLSHGTWQRRYGGASDVLGRTIRLDGEPHSIVGVVEEGFRQLTPRTEEPGVWTPAAMDRLGEEVLPEGSMPWAIPVARLAPDAPRERAQAELAAVAGRWLEENPDLDGSPRWDLRWTTLESELTEGARPALLILQAAVGLVLLLACTNVANLFLVRMSARRGELAIRTALGASRGRLVRQLLTESVVLSGLGGLVGLAVLAAGFEFFVALAPPELPRLGEVSLDAPVLLFAMTVSLGTGVLFGVVPGLAATLADPHVELKEGGRTTAGSRGRHRLSQALVVAEITLTLVLVVGAGLLVRSFVALSAQELGFRTDEVLAVRMSAPEHRYETVPALERYQARLLERIRVVPGVEAVGLANNVPLSRSSARRPYVVEGESEAREAEYGVVSPGYFRALDIPVTRGRAFGPEDRREGRRVVVVDEAMAREVWPGRDPLDRRFRLEGEDEWMTVVGVSASIRGSGLGGEPAPGFHVPFRQRPQTPVELAVGKDMVLLIRAPTAPTELAASVREAIWGVDPGQPVPEVATLASIVERSTGPERFRAVLLGAFALVALLLAVAGVYGVVGNLLAERTHEFGVRRALGASDGDVVRTVLAWGLRLTAVGIVAGLVAAFWLTRFLAGLLFGVGSTDPATILLAVATVAGAALAACFVPAWRATRVDAVIALRSD